MTQLKIEISAARHILKTEGVKALFAKYGWKLVALLFCYYLVRDVSLYILLPYLITQGFR